MSFFVKITLPEGLGAESREAFSALVPRLAARFSFQGLSDWSVDVQRSRVLGVESEFHDLRGHGRVSREMRVYFASKADGAAFRALLSSVVGDVKVSAPLRQADKDWMKEWRRHYKVQKISAAGQALWIVPAWKRGPARGAKVRIYPGQAFGTGTHATTQLCLKLFLSHGLREGRMLDFGAGTGVLAIAAARFGYQGLAVESDPVALEQCRVNLKLNRVKGVRAARAMPSGRRFGLVFANVLSPVLLERRAALKAAVAPGGLLILSGILAAEARAFLRKFGLAGGFKLAELATQGEWAAIALSRK